MDHTYCERWNFPDVAPVIPLSEADARQRDAEGELYTAVIGEPANPEVLVEVVRPDYVGVYFPDKLGRQWQKFAFRRVDDALFLESITRWQYGDESARMLGEAELIEQVKYREDGTVHRQVRDKKAREKRDTDYHSVSLDINWEPVPEFGDWASVARFDRDKPAS
ncbi:hypothetical protein [Actinosynnema sp. NPDC020468]|uniref:hypothetical protein n=1 Tax=Actinosynnema sp. NPDC020468 TaxID=3154488 RepID=UPI0033DE542F